jgi:L-histidine N-alpha-methyltransferase
MTDAAATREITIDVHLTSDDIRAALRRDVTEGLTAAPKSLPPKWFYDDVGCELFDQITRLPEYYPTEREREILLREADTIAELTAAETFVELGSGTSDKTRTLLDALTAAGSLRQFAPFDVNAATLEDACEALADEYPDLHLHGVVGDFDHHLDRLPTGGRRLVGFLGSTIGNFEPAPRAAFLARLAGGMAPGDHLLLGTDLVKDSDRLQAAYDDRAGVTAEFNRNVLRVVNRELHADFAVDSFAHVAWYDPVEEWIEMRLRSLVDQDVLVRDLDLDVSFAAGEEMRTEISAKFRPEGVEQELEAAGFELVRWMTDAEDDFALSLAVRR